MNYGQLIQLVTKYGRRLGPHAFQAFMALGPLLDKNPGVQRFTEGIGERFKKMEKGSQITGQIELAKEFSTDAVTEQTMPDRQDLARVWLQRSKASDMAVRATQNMPRKVAKARRKEIAGQVDALLAEIIETVSKWAEV